MSEALTQRQRDVLDVIRQYLKAHGAPPTRADIARLMGFKSVNAAEDHLKALARKGAIILTSGTSRGIQLPEKRSGIPLFRAPFMEKAEPTSYLDLPRTFYPRTTDYFLQIPDMSLQAVGLVKNDLLAVHQTTHAKPNQIVVASVKSRFFIQAFTAAEDIQVEGVGVGIIRTLPDAL
jgi:repressor LexA